jgi:hypothetical protein
MAVFVVGAADLKELATGNPMVEPLPGRCERRRGRLHRFVS